MGQKLNSKLLFIFTKMMDFTYFIFHKVA